MADPQEVRDARKVLGELLATHRSAAGHTQVTFAPLTNYVRSTIGNVETGRQNVPRNFWVGCDRLLDAGGALVAGYDDLQELIRTARLSTTVVDREALEQGPSAVVPSTVAAEATLISDSHLAHQRMPAQHRTDFFPVREGESPAWAALRELGHAPELEPISEVAARLLALRPYPDDTACMMLELGIGDIVARYETEGPGALVREVVALRRLLEPLCRQKVASPVRRRLLRLSGQASGLLAYISVNLGRFAQADAYGLEAFALAEMAADSDLMAWVRGTQSFNAYYQQRFDRALAFAQDGLTYAGSGPQAVRLKANCEARALAAMGGRTRDAQAAVAAAYRYGERLDVPAGISSCISLGVYSHGRIVANAITVNQALGLPHTVLELVAEIESTVEASDSNWSRSLVRLDHAATLLQPPFSDVDQAMALATVAIEAASNIPITSVLQRGHALLTGAAPWVKVASVREFRERMRQLTASCVAGHTNVQPFPGRSPAER